MHKKLYKAKKNWVIGVIAGALLMIGGASATGYADSGTNQNTQTIKNVENESQLNLEQEKEEYKECPKYDHSNDENNLKLVNVQDRNFVDENEETNAYVSPNGGYGIKKSYVVNSSVKNFTKIEEQKKASYVYNGYSYAIKDTDNNKNAKAINNLSGAISYNDYRTIEKDLKDSKHGREIFYDDGKRVFIYKGKITKKNRKRLKKIAWKYRPKITFDKVQNDSRITSLLQTTYTNVTKATMFSEGWNGFTFRDGKQISFSDVINDDNVDAVSSYLNGRIGDPGDSAIIVNQHKMPVLSVFDKLGKFVNAETGVLFLKDGIYAVYNGVVQGYSPVMIKIPLKWVKIQYSAFYTNSVVPKIDSNELNENDEFQNIVSTLVGQGLPEAKAKVMALAMIKELKAINGPKPETYKNILTVGENTLKKGLKESVTKIVIDVLGKETSVSAEDISLVKSVVHVGDYSTTIPENFIADVQAFRAYRDPRNFTKENKDLRKLDYKDYRSRNISAAKNYIAGTTNAGIAKLTKNSKVIAIVAVVSSIIAMAIAIAFWDKYRAQKIATKYGIELTHNSNWKKWFDKKTKKK